MEMYRTANPGMTVRPASESSEQHFQRRKERKWHSRRGLSSPFSLKSQPFAFLCLLKIHRQHSGTVKPKKDKDEKELLRYAS